MTDAVPTAPADAAPTSWVRQSGFLRPYLQLSRFDRPVGFWLLALPCLIGIAFARLGHGFETNDWHWVIWFGVGAIAMRGAGCTWNDILDRKIDARVARTALRPLPSGAVSVRQALVWLALQLVVGLLVLLMLPQAAQLMALGSIPLVALYPLMKRITWWPQLWLGLTFNWGILVAAATLLSPPVNLAVMLAYAGLVFWTLGYDTIYAIQDKEDDALIGVRSTARRFGSKVRTGVTICYAICVALLGAAAWLAAGWMATLMVAPFAMHLAVQAGFVRGEDGAGALALFRSNREAGLLLTAGWAFIAATN